MTRKVVVGYHGHCFDGMSSAVLVTRLIQEVEGAPLSFEYRGLDHQPGGSHVPDAVLAGEINAVVDFRYSTSPNLHWYFDHHVSGVSDGDERIHLDQSVGSRKFFDPSYGSCCKLLADVARERFGLDLSDLHDLIHWADIIDAARFESAEVAVALQEPALQLMTVIESHGDDAFLLPRIRELLRGTSLAELAEDRRVRKLLGPLLRVHRKTCDTIRERSSLSDGVVVFDLVGSGNDRYNKFIPYWLHPGARYTVAVTAGKSRAKVSVGSNPWSPVPRTHNIAELCARYGGGGHPVVGAVSLKAGQVERARQVAKEIAAALRTEALSESGAS